jgi:hypothetical protein
VHHNTTRDWSEAADDEDRVVSAAYANGLLRLLTTPAVMGADEAMTQTEAWEAYDRWMEDDRILFIDEPPRIESTFRNLSRRSTHSQDMA